MNHHLGYAHPQCIAACWRIQYQHRLVLFQQVHALVDWYMGGLAYVINSTIAQPDINLPVLMARLGKSLALVLLLDSWRLCQTW